MGAPTSGFGTQLHRRPSDVRRRWLALGNWLSVLVTAVLPVSGLIRRIHVEEAALLETLGEPYRRYASGKQRLGPGVW